MRHLFCHSWPNELTKPIKIKNINLQEPVMLFFFYHIFYLNKLKAESRDIRTEGGHAQL